MLESVQNVLTLNNGCVVGVAQVISWIILLFLFCEYGMCHRSRFRSYDFTNHELVAFAGMSILNHFGRFFVDVSIISRIFLNRFLLVHKFAYVHTSGTCVLF